ncbi:hypothetical protein [Actinocatenispora rupis]|uniref:Uncharacterized protein n=1 Tax=Actinocatenispora rupis TaxID=519421 RepID=A0A8J3J6B1_9ACTN|nr:hypothetical protein [Actinocatenispora rupis]GID14918.1 hypothetical protein Aru02nite_58070 [Actinocatenispora rupis]
MAGSDVIGAAQQSLVAPVRPLADARVALQAAVGGAEQISLQAQRLGNAQVFAQASQIHGQLKAAYSKLDAANTTLQSAAGKASAAAAADNTDGIQQHLVQAKSHAERASTTVAAVHAELKPLPAVVQRVLRNASPGPLAAAINTASSHLPTVLGLIGQATQKVDETITQTRQTGNF